MEVMTILLQTVMRTKRYKSEQVVNLQCWCWTRQQLSLWEVKLMQCAGFDWQLVPQQQSATYNHV